MATRIQLRRDNAADWTALNPTLSQGEIGFEFDTGKIKIGDGASGWTSLDYFLDTSELASTYLTQANASTTYATLAGATFTGRIIPRTGGTSASSSPIDFVAGSLLTTPENGALEYASDGLYITSNPGSNTTGTGRGLIRAPQIVYSLANSTAATTSTPQSVFASANDVLSVLEPAKMYRFSGKYYLTSTFSSGTANNQILFAFSNAPTAIKYNYKTMNQTTATTSIAMVGSPAVTTNIQVSPSVTSTINYVVEFDGYFTTHATNTSTFTPQFQMSTTGTSTVVTAGSYIEVEKLGSSTQTLISGNWA